MWRARARRRRRGQAGRGLWCSVGLHLGWAEARAVAPFALVGWDSAMGVLATCRGEIVRRMALGVSMLSKGFFLFLLESMCWLVVDKAEAVRGAWSQVWWISEAGIACASLGACALSPCSQLQENVL